MKTINHGTFVISLDFELFWGVRDKKNKESYGENILAVRQIIPRLLEVFKHYGIKATFATVGFLFFATKKELLQNLPEKKPSYIEKNFSPYGTYMDSIGENETNDPFHFAKSLIEMIQNVGLHEIASHTFSHYYCLEEGQTIVEFEDDLSAAKNIAHKMNIQLQSLVFPRNQTNGVYLEMCQKQGFFCYRGNENHWIYQAHSNKTRRYKTFLKRILRLLDCYVNLSGHHCYTYEHIIRETPHNIPASRFLRPFNFRLRALESLKFRRIKRSMTYAAKHGLVYHLWWHPHNFAKYQDKNFEGLDKILQHFQFLNKRYGFDSLSMSALLKKIGHGSNLLTDEFNHMKY